MFSDSSIPKYTLSQFEKMGKGHKVGCRGRDGSANSLIEWKGSLAVCSLVGSLYDLVCLVTRPKLQGVKRWGNGFQINRNDNGWLYSLTEKWFHCH